MKHHRLDTCEAFRQQFQTLAEVSYAASLNIVNEIKPNAIGKTLVKPCALEMNKIVLGQESKKKLRQIFLSDNTAQRRISDLANNIKQQVIFDIKKAQFGLFAFYLYENTDVSACSQLMMFCRYFTNTNIKEEFLFCSALETNTKSVNVMEKISEFFKCTKLKWKNPCGMCPKRALSMLEAKSGFQTLV